MNIKLSNRLQAVADEVDPGAIVADIGTDHGYLAVYLTVENIAQHVIASDRAKGPLTAADQLVSLLSLKPKIETRLDDGLMVLKPNEVDTICIAGMGGMTIIDILSQAPEVLKTAKKLVLQPQRGASKLRRWLAANHFRITAENLAVDDGFYYIVIVAEPGEMQLSPEEVSFGPLILKNGHPLLAPYLRLKQADLSRLLEAAATGVGEDAKRRQEQLAKEIEQIKTVLNQLDKQNQ